MVDQATQLRRLALRAARAGLVEDERPPRLIAFSGGQRGIGVTTLALNVAVAIAGQGERVVLVDADPYQPLAAALCGLPPQPSLLDVLSARRDIHEVLQLGPNGVQLVPSLASAGTAAAFSDTAQRRLLRQLQSLGRYADLVLVDLGSGGNAASCRFAQAAGEVVLVASPGATSIMSVYAAVKQFAEGCSRLAVRLIINRAADQQAADEVHRRIDLSCRRFLGFGVGCAGYVSEDARFAVAAAAGIPLVRQAPDCDAARQLDAVARHLLSDEGTWMRADLATASAQAGTGKVANSS